MTRNSQTTPIDRLSVLFVATKPAFPPNDGGRLLIWNSLTELAARGHRITFVAPDLGSDTRESIRHLGSVCDEVHLVRARPSNILLSAATALLTRKPLSILRHTHDRIRRVVAGLLDRQSFDVVHAEQIQAFFNLPLNGTIPPVVLRAQNVESQLWRMVSLRKPRTGWISRDEARKMAVYEARAVRAAAATIVLTQPDADTLGGGAGASARRISVIRPPFPATLERCDHALEGKPAVILVAGGWFPNRDSVAWFLEDIWPDVRAASPDAHLHVFGPDQQTATTAITYHPAPVDSSKLFPPGSVLVVPLRIASGIRMKILEAWARGVPVVATPTAVRGLEDVGEHAYILARNGAEFGAAISQVRRSRKMTQRLVDAGREALAESFQPQRVAKDLETVYRACIHRSGGQD